MTKPILGIDFDGVLAFTQSSEQFLVFIASELRQFVDWSAWTRTHSLTQALPGRSMTDISHLAQEFYALGPGVSMLKVPEAHEVLRRYKDRFNYVLITARQRLAATLALKFLESDYPDISFTQIHTDNYGKKCAVLKEIGAQLILEDSANEARVIAGSGVKSTVILFPTFHPHIEFGRTDGIHFTHAYKEAHRAITEIDKLMAMRAAWLEVDQYLEGWLSMHATFLFDT